MSYAQLDTDALVMAIWRRGKPDALLHHFDCGSQASISALGELNVLPKENGPD